MEKQRLRVIKIGGKLIEDKEKLRTLLTDFAELTGLKILVHGGGSMATDLATRLGYETKMIDGRRITDENSLDVILMTYAGLINKRIVAQLQGLNCDAIGLCGADGKSIVSKRRKEKPINYGLVGDIEKINSKFISRLLEQGLTPVFSAISCSDEGELLNTNGDSVAGEMAKAMSKIFDIELFYLFEKKGVLKDVEDEESVIKNINNKEYRELLKQNVISKGMLPKLKNCFEALDSGVTKIQLGNEHLLRKGSLHTEITN